MNVVDTSGWLEYFADGRNAGYFAPAIEDVATLLVPTITLYEAWKVVSTRRSEREADQAASLMSRGQIVDLTSNIALSAAGTSVELGLPMADSIILATARTHDAVLWTQDADFRDIHGVRYVEAPS